MKTRQLVILAFLMTMALWVSPLSPPNRSAAQGPQPGSPSLPTPTVTNTQPVSLSGWFHIIWVDDYINSNIASVEYMLIDDQDHWHRILLDQRLVEPFGGPLTFNRKRVIIVGKRTTSPYDAVQAQTIQLEQPDEAAATDSGVTSSAVLGSQPWVTILCRFKDYSSVTPKPKSWFEGLMGSSYPGMDHYWQEASFNSFNLTGSVVVGWYNLPQPLFYYVDDRNGNGQVDNEDALKAELALNDCTGVADANVFFPDFYGINLMFNYDYGCCAQGGQIVLTKDGQTKIYGVTWMPQDLANGGWEDHSVLAHEMGHAFGLPHSSGNYNYAYDSKWDVMSHSQRPCSPRGTYGCTGVHPISYHKDLLGWIPPARKFFPALGSSQTITIERLGQPVFSSNYLMAQIPISGSTTQFYTVEARRFIGYDTKIPGEAIIIHDVDTAREPINNDYRPALVVDPDNNGDPNDAAAMWLPGEVFVDTANQITMTVNSATVSGFRVTIQYHPTFKAIYLPLVLKGL